MKYWDILVMVVSTNIIILFLFIW